MQTKEPFFDHDVSLKNFYLPVPDDLKITTSTESCKSVKFDTPPLKGSSRRGSMEPYFPQRRYSQQSSSRSSYARLSDVFDYNYLDLFSGADNENAIASDSDTDYEDEDAEYRSKAKTSTRSYVYGNRSEEPVSDSESGLEDYHVHLLTFKANSSAQYTRPPRNRQSSSSDHFDFRPTDEELAFLPTSQHPEVKAISVPKLASTVVFEEPEIELEKFLVACAYPLAGQERDGARPFTRAKITRKRTISDSYQAVQAKTSLSDNYEISHHTKSFI